MIAETSSRSGLLAMPGDLEHTRPLPRRRRTMVELTLGVTRWASPPLGISWRIVALLLVLGDLGFFLLLWALLGEGG